MNYLPSPFTFATLAALLIVFIVVFNILLILDSDVWTRGPGQRRR